MWISYFSKMRFTLPKWWYMQRSKYLYLRCQLGWLNMYNTYVTNENRFSLYALLQLLSGVFPCMFKRRHLQYWKYMRLSIDMEWFTMYFTYVTGRKKMIISISILSLAVCTPACSNGGTCNAGNTCSCPSTWSGTRCTTREFFLQ